MGRYRKVLVAFDGSESSRNALVQAIKLASMEKCWVKVVAVVPNYEGDLDLTGVGNIEAAIKGPGEKLLAEARAIAEAEGGSVITNLEQGEAYERIVDVASAENCDIIVMGRRGKARIERALMGGVTARVIGHTDRDVLVVSRGAKVGWERIVLPTDGSKYSEAAAEHAIDIAKSYGGEIHAVSVVDVNEEFQAEAPEAVSKLIQRAKVLLEGVKAKAAAAGVKADATVREGNPAECIADIVEETGASVVIMGSHGKTGLKRLLMGSVTEKVIGLVGCPVLVVRV